MTTEETKEPVQLTFTCLRGHTLHEQSEDYLVSEATENKARGMKCPQCNASILSVSDGVDIMRIAEPKISTQHKSRKTR